MAQEVKFENTNITTLNSLAIVHTTGNKEGGFYLPQVTGDDHKKFPILKNGLMVYEQGATAEDSGPVMFTGQVVDADGNITTKGNFIKVVLRNVEVGTVNGPAVSVNGNIAVWNGTTGMLLADAGKAPAVGVGSITTNDSGVIQTNNIKALTGILNIDSPVSINTNAPYIYNADTATQCLNKDGVASTNNKKGSKASSPYAISANGGIYAAEFFASSNYQPSSRKIKTILKDANIGAEVESIIEKLVFHKYEHIDPMEHGSGVHYGVIAEELAEILPDSVTERKHFIPNIMQHATVESLENDKYLIKLASAVKDLECTDKLQIILNHKLIAVDIISISTNEIIVTAPTTLSDTIFVYGTEEALPLVDNTYLNKLSLVLVKSLLERVRKLESK